MRKKEQKKEEAHSRLATFWMGTGEKFSLHVMDSLGGRFCIFYEAPTMERLKRQIAEGKISLDYVARKQAQELGIPLDEARKKVEAIHTEAVSGQLTKLEYLPDLLQQAIQQALNDFEFSIRAQVSEAIGLNLSIENPFGPFPVEVRLRKGVVERRTIFPPHRPKDSGNFDKEGFLSAIEDAVCSLQKKNRRMPNQLEVARNIKGFASSADVLRDRIRRCGITAHWKDYVKAIITEAGLRGNFRRKS